MAHADFDFNLYDTWYSSYSPERRRLIEDFDQFSEYYFEIGLKMPKAVFNAFIYDPTGLIICSE